MTPCQKLGYKVGDEFFIPPTEKNYPYEGEIVTLEWDDGSSCPRFYLPSKKVTRYIELNRVVPTETSSCPSHYDSEIQPKDFMKSNFTSEEYEGFLKGNIIKYVSRYKQKDGIKDLKKAIDYLNWLIEHEER